MDKEPPRILSHYPESDALEVARDTAVEIAFSEPMNREQTEAAIFTSPAGPLQLSWRGPRLRIAMPLAEERTYVLTVGTGARDLAGQCLDEIFYLGFCHRLPARSGAGAGPGVPRSSTRGRCPRLGL